MKDQSTEGLEAPSSQVGSAQSSSVPRNPGRQGYFFRGFLRWMNKDWQTHKYFFFGALAAYHASTSSCVLHTNFTHTSFVVNRSVHSAINVHTS
jgi:hypothetical protein